MIKRNNYPCSFLLDLYYSLTVLNTSRLAIPFISSDLIISPQTKPNSIDVIMVVNNLVKFLTHEKGLTVIGPIDILYIYGWANVSRSDDLQPYYRLSTV